MTKKFTKTVSAMAVVFATMISSNVIVSAAEVFFLLPDVPLLFDPLPVGFLLRSLSATENEFDRKL